MPFNAKILLQVMEKRGVPPSMMCSHIKMSIARFDEALRGMRVPSERQIFAISDALGVPAYALFMDKFELNDPEVVDFRKKSPERFKPGLAAGKFDQIFRLQKYLADLFSLLNLDPPDSLTSAQPDENPEQFASNIANLLSIPELQTSAKTKAEFYAQLRSAVEDLGVHVLQDHNFPQEIDGFALHHKNFTSNLIFVNSIKRNHGAKSFTLAHELAHILGSRSAISDNYDNSNQVETFCNKFAASLLLPRSRFFQFVEKRLLSFNSYEEAINSADVIANHFKTSVSAALIRAAELGLSEPSYYSRFAQGFGDPAFPDSLKKQGGGGPEGPEPGIMDLATLGKRSVALISRALRENVTTEYEVFKKTGLSRKRIQGLLSIEKSKNIKVAGISG